jgi:hypothetical protein
MTTAQEITVLVRLVHVGDHVWRVQRVDTGKVLGLVEGRNRTWRAKASMRAFLGDGPDGGEPLGDWVPRALYAPLLASEGHHYLPGTHRSQEAAVAALQTYLDDHRAPAMGYRTHDQIRHQEAS